MDPLEWALRELVQSVSRLSLGPEEQANFIRSIFRTEDPLVNCDELALQFDDSYVMVPQLVDRGLLSHEAAGRLDALAAQLDAMSAAGKPELWTLKSVQEADEWEQVRLLACSLLDLLPKAAGSDPPVGH